MKNGEEIKPSARVIGQIEVLGNEITFRLTLKAVELTDAATYKCVATNSFGSVSTEGAVTVESKKVFIVTGYFLSSLFFFQLNQQKLHQFRNL